MSRTLQFRRLGTATLANTIGANGELIINSTNKVLTVHDGVTPGGFALLNEATDFDVDQYARNTANTNSSDIIILQGVNATQNTNITLVNNFTQNAYNKANAAYDYANTIISDTQIDPFARQTANASFNKANSANSLAQTAFDAANAAAQTIPQNAQSTDYTLQLTDAGKHIYYTQASNTILYIPTTSNVAFANGSTIMIVSRTSSGANVTISPNTGVTMYLAGNTTSASRNVTTYGMATLIQVAANTWFINGTGVS